MKKEEIIAKIIVIEWKMFQDVPNIGGTAPCQEERQTFEIMRLSQAASWSEAALESYLDDLTEAQKQERNLMTEKYARMMETVPVHEKKIRFCAERIDGPVHGEYAGLQNVQRINLLRRGGTDARAQCLRADLFRKRGAPFG